MASPRRAATLGLAGLLLPLAVLALMNTGAEAMGGPPAESGPRYVDYPAAAIYRGRVAEPRFRPGADRWPDSDPRFRGQVAIDLAKGPDFAGAYVVVMTSCGTGCSYVVIVDARTGEIYQHLPFRMVVAGPPEQYRGLMFRLTSRLLTVEGFIDQSVRPTRAYYEWSGRSLRLLRTVSILRWGPLSVI